MNGILKIQYYLKMSKVGSLIDLNINKIVSEPNLVVESLNSYIPDTFKEKIIDRLLKNPYNLYNAFHTENFDPDIYPPSVWIAVNIHYKYFNGGDFQIPVLEIGDMLEILDIMMNFTDVFNENDEAFIYFMLFDIFGYQDILNKFNNTSHASKAICYLRLIDIRGNIKLFSKLYKNINLADETCRRTGLGHLEDVAIEPVFVCQVEEEAEVI